MKPVVRQEISLHTLSRIISGRFNEWGSYSALEWEQLVQLAQAQGVGPLLYLNLSKARKFSCLPETAHNSLRGMYASSWFTNRTIIQELENLASCFSRAGIPAVALKGACLALTVYADASLRPMGDLDVLVPKERLAEAVQIARLMGYVETTPEASAGLTELLNHEICLQKPGQQEITLELHHSLVADKSFTYAVPVDWFWEQTEPLESQAKDSLPGLRVLTPTAQVLYAAAHAMLQHGGRKAPLRWFYDLDLLIRSYSERMDWELLVSQAEKFEWGSALDVALSQANAFFDTPIPASILDRLSHQSDRHRRLVELKQIPPTTHILEERQKLLSLNNYGRFRLVVALIAPNPSYMIWRYQLKSPWLLPLYYPYRWWGILKDAVRTGIHLLRKDQSKNLSDSAGFSERSI
jgi:hypothetical protein